MKLKYQRRRRPAEYGPLGYARAPLEIQKKFTIGPDNDSPIYDLFFDEHPMSILSPNMGVVFFRDLVPEPPRKDFLGWHVEFDAECISRPLDFFPDGTEPVPVHDIDARVKAYARKQRLIPVTAHFLEVMLQRPEGIPERFRGTQNFAMGTVVSNPNDLFQSKWVSYITYCDPKSEALEDYRKPKGWQCCASELKTLGALNPFKHRVLFLDPKGLKWVKMID